RWFDEHGLRASPAPSHVEVRAADGRFEYLVNGQRQVIKGMGLNTQYSRFMSPTDRTTQLDADMAAYGEMGVNTVLGWDPAEFDQTLLDSAARHDIGVVLPFELDRSEEHTSELQSP